MRQAMLSFIFIGTGFPYVAFDWFAIPCFRQRNLRSFRHPTTMCRGFGLSRLHSRMGLRFVEAVMKGEVQHQDYILRLCTAYISHVVDYDIESNYV